MDSRVKEVTVEATRASDEERATFGEVVMKLMQAGVERYHCDLVRGEKTYYLPNGESEVVAGEAVGRRIFGSGRGCGGAGYCGWQDSVQDVLHARCRSRLRRLPRLPGRVQSRILRPHRR